MKKIIPILLIAALIFVSGCVKPSDVVTANKPDFKIEYIIFGSTTGPDDSRRLGVQIVVINKGAQYTGNLPYKFTIFSDGKEIHITDTDKENVNLPKEGELSIIHHGIKKVEPGKEYKIIAEIDPYNDIKESNENNNKAEKTYRVR